MGDSTLLSAEELVKKGLEKSQRTLPVKGPKETRKTGSWIEEKQIQESLESRKALLSDQRIEKWGVVSHALWDAERQLARVTEQRGAHWGHLGHVVDRQVYLYPEEALFLIEMNCLALKYCGIQVSLQQAYALLLRGTIGMLEYQVYSELSRVGYKVLRSAVKDILQSTNEKSVPENKEDETDDVEVVNAEDRSNILNKDKAEHSIDEHISKNNENEHIVIVNTELKETEVNLDIVMQVETVECDDDNQKKVNGNNSQSEDVEMVSTENNSESNDHHRNIEKVEVSESSTQHNDVDNPKNENKKIPIHKCKIKSLSSLQLPDFFRSIPNFNGKEPVTVSAPQEDFLPRNVFLYKTEYTLKPDEITSKINTRTTTYETVHTPQSRNNPIRELLWKQQMMKQITILPLIRLWNMNNSYGNHYINPFVQMPYFAMHQNLSISRSIPNNLSSKSTTITPAKKTDHLQAIRRIAFRLKKLRKTGGQRQDEYLVSLKKLIGAYNEKYKENLELTENLTLLNDTDDAETVDLEEDERPKRKKQRMSDVPDNTDKSRYLQSIKITAAKLKQLKTGGANYFRNRRSLLEVIKVFNKKFNMSINLTPDYEITDSKQIVLDSSSDSDCVITDLECSIIESTPRRKKTIERTRQTQKETPASTSKNIKVLKTHEDVSRTNDFYAQHSSNFSKWLPGVNDWGRPEVTRSQLSQHRLLHSSQESFVYNFFESVKPEDFKDWEHLKTEFWTMVEKNVREEAPREAPACDINPLLSPEVCTDIDAALEKVRVIQSFEAPHVETTLKATFDVFDREVKNFKKSALPVPTFRVICLDENAPVPSVDEMFTLQKAYSDSTPVLIAVVGATISYVLITPSDLPVNIKNTYV